MTGIISFMDEFNFHLQHQCLDVIGIRANGRKGRNLLPEAGESSKQTPFDEPCVVPFEFFS